MNKKICPYCQHKLSFSELLLLDEHAPRRCKKCGNFLKTSLVGSIVSAVIPVILCALALYLIDIDFIFAASLLLLIPLLRVALAEPTKYSLNSNSQNCLRCGRPNMSLKSSFANVCEKCLITERKYSAN